MIRFRLRELLADLEFRQQRRITLEDVADATGIHRTTLSKISRQHGYNTTTENLNALCKYFGCPIEKLVEYVSEPPATYKVRRKTRAVTEKRGADG